MYSHLRLPAVLLFLAKIPSKGDGFCFSICEFYTICRDEVMAAHDRLTNARSAGSSFFDPNVVNQEPDEEGDNGILLYPNPLTHDVLHMQFSSNKAETAVIQIMSLDSKVVFRTNRISMKALIVWNST